MRGWAVLLALLTSGCALALQPYPHRKYIIIRTDSEGEKKSSLSADRIEAHGSCVLFYRGDRVDTVLCPSPLESLTVTEDTPN